MIFDIEITVYSLIYATVMAMTCDRVHVQNISLSVMIFTKKDGVEQAIMNEMRRGVTEWEGKGSYTKEDSKVFVVMIRNTNRMRSQELSQRSIRMHL